MNDGDKALIAVIDDIVYNENKHVVSVFKEHLLFDDIYEFLDQYFSFQQAKEEFLR